MRPPQNLCYLLLKFKFKSVSLIFKKYQPIYFPVRCKPGSSSCPPYWGLSFLIFIIFKTNRSSFLKFLSHFKALSRLHTGWIITLDGILFGGESRMVVSHSPGGKIVDCSRNSSIAYLFVNKSKSPCHLFKSPCKIYSTSNSIYLSFGLKHVILKKLKAKTFISKYEHSMSLVSLKNLRLRIRIYS